MDESVKIAVRPVAIQPIINNMIINGRRYRLREPNREYELPAIQLEMILDEAEDKGAQDGGTQTHDIDIQMDQLDLPNTPVGPLTPTPMPRSTLVSPQPLRPVTRSSVNSSSSGRRSPRVRLSPTPGRPGGSGPRGRGGNRRGNRVVVLGDNTNNVNTLLQSTWCHVSIPYACKLTVKNGPVNIRMMEPVKLQTRCIEANQTEYLNVGLYRFENIGLRNYQAILSFERDDDEDED